MSADSLIEVVSDAPPRQVSHAKSILKWFRRAIATVVVLAVVAAIGVAATALVRGTWSVNPVLSGSMRPGLPVGGVVISERVPVRELSLRDVIVFNNPDKPSDEMVHRITGISTDSSGQIVLRTQGDANTVRDPWKLVIQGNYAYRVRWSLPLIGYVAVAYENHRGVVLVIVGFILLGVAGTSLWEARRRRGPTVADVE